MPELNTVTDPYLPEPKGVSTADEGQIYIADGAGSGSWTYLPCGWGMYDDNTAQAFNTTATKLSINGSGANQNESYLPLAIRGSTSLWNTSTDFLTPISTGDSYVCRLNLPVTGETGSPTEIIVDLDISGTGTPTTVIATQYAKAGRSTPYTVTMTFPIFTLGTFIANGGQFFLSTDSGSVTVTNPGLLIIQTGSGNI